MRRFLFFIFCTGCIAFHGKAQGHVVAEQGAWCWFADPRALHYEDAGKKIDMTYIGYIDTLGNIKATQHNFLTGRTDEVVIRSEFQPDDHNNPTFLILPDGRVMIFYTRHTTEPRFYYRISRTRGDITDLGEEKTITVTNNTTYPSPFILSNDPDHIYLCWRGINWHPTIGRLTMPDRHDNTSFDWGPKQIIQSTGGRPYANYYSNGKDRIWLTYTTGHPDNEYPNWVYFSGIAIPKKKGSGITLRDVTDNVLATVDDGPHRVDRKDYAGAHPAVVVDSASNSRGWIWDVTEDKDHKPVIAMVRINKNKSSHDYYYVKWTGKEWRKTFLTNAGGHFHKTPTTERCYSGGMAIDDASPAMVYCSVPVTGMSGKVYELVKYKLDASGNFTTDTITRNSPKNNVRPYMISNAKDSPLRLLWMRGDYFFWLAGSKDYPGGYPTSIYSDYQIHEKSKRDVINIIRKVNDYWQRTHPSPENAFWNTAVYHTGNIAAYQITGEERYRQYSEAWAEKNEWKGAKSDDRTHWKFSYGETDDHVLFGDWQVCFQTYVDLYKLAPDRRKIARAQEVMEYQMSTPGDNYLWWADGLYMVMPGMTKLYTTTHNPLYLQKLYTYFRYAKGLMYDAETGLFFRDAKYSYPKHKTVSGKKDFWARGNGWVFAALAKVLQDLPADDIHRAEYIEVYQTLAKALKQTQQPNGSWTRSILDAAHAPGNETSGTAFFVYGYLWGINNGILPRSEYKEVAKKGWQYLSETALQADGLVGYVQPIGERADQHKNVNERSTADFGVGAFLLAAAEMTRYLESNNTSYFGKP
jgi:rhamnogalacturonyl hydrolase YesR